MKFIAKAEPQRLQGEIMTGSNGIVFISYHKPFPLLNEPFLRPIHAGRACVSKTKDGNLSLKDIKWLKANTIGDDTGDNISKRNREYCECTALYWIWKNVDLKEMRYVGVVQYRRQLILNDYFSKAKEDSEKEVYKCVHFSKQEKDICHHVGLRDDNICNLMEKYDCIIPYASSLDKMNISSVYQDWVDRITGVHIDDLILLEEYMNERFPVYGKLFSEYLNSSEKLMYQIFIAKPQLFEEYCKWLFSILFDIDKKIDTDLYTVNGKRTLGYLAEILYGFYFSVILKKQNYKIMPCGVTYLE